MAVIRTDSANQEVTLRLESIVEDIENFERLPHKLKDTTWNLGRETKKSLPEIKSIGDRAAHNRRYVANQADVDKILHGLRATVDELLHLANLK